MARTKKTPSVIKAAKQRLAQAAQPPQKAVDADAVSVAAESVDAMQTALNTANEAAAMQAAVGMAEAADAAAAMQELQRRGPGRPADPNINRTASKNRGLQPGLERFTVAVPETVLADMRDYAYTVRRPLKDVIADAFTEYLAAHDDVEIIRRPEK